MNERIQELIRQATRVIEPDDPDYRQEIFDKKLFAQLIVRECIGVIGEENYTMLTGKAYSTQLKRHFGVEE